MNCIHFAHDRAYYENVQMALHNTNVSRFMAFGVAGLSVVGDSLAAIRYDDVYPIRNDEGLTVGFRRAHPESETPQFGNNDPRADDYAIKVCSRFHEELDKQPLYRNAQATLSILTITSNIVYGKATGATPDGRLAGEPFAPGANPMHGRDKQGAIASLCSVAKLPYSKCMDGISNTFCLLPSALGASEEKRPTSLVALLDGYFLKNAHHININVLSREILKDADKHPEKYPNLSVRVSGYCVKFSKLTPEQRKEVISRTMHSTSVATRINKKTILPQDNVPSTMMTTKHHAVKGSVYGMETFSTADGPGIRMDVFLQGCPKRCTFCCNPETLKIVDPNLNPEFAMTDTEIVSIVDKYADFLMPNNGGITISGGEPLLQPNFVASVFEGAHKLGVTTCLDTACYGSTQDWDMVLPHTDYVMLCLKAMHNATAAHIARSPQKMMAKSKDFALFIRDKYPEIKLSLRWVLMKGITDTQSELKRLVLFAIELGPVFTHVELIPYHELGKDKYESIGETYELDEMEPYKEKDAVQVKAYLEDSGVKATLSIV